MLLPTCKCLFPAGRVVCVMHEHSEIANILMTEEHIVYTITKPITFNKSTGQCEGMNGSGKSNSEHCVVFQAESADCTTNFLHTETSIRGNCVFPASAIELKSEALSL